MANELHAHATSGLTLYAVILNAVGQIWNTSGTPAFEAYNGANWTDYDIALTEAGAGIYLASMPAVAAGAYSYAVYEQAGANPATTDTLRGTGYLEWDGSAVLPLATLEALVDDIETRLGTPSDLGGGATIAANLVVIEGQTDDIGAAGAGLSAIPWNAAWDAEVQSEATDALNAYDPPTNAELEARTLVAASYFDPAADTVAHVTLVDTTTTNTDMRGTDGAELAGAAAAAVVGLAATGEAAAAVATLNDITVADIIAGITEGTLDLQEILRIILAALAGKASGGGTATIKFRDQADTKDRITATVDVDGNRTLVVVDGS